MGSVKKMTVNPETHCPGCLKELPSVTLPDSSKVAGPCDNPLCYISATPLDHFTAMNGDVWRILEEARAYLLRNHFWVAHHVFSLQRPYLTRSIPTAGVGMDKDGRILFLFNPDFLLKLAQTRETSTHEYNEFDENGVETRRSYTTSDPIDVAFVMAHEAGHILSGHVGKIRHPSVKNPMLYNICADVIINTWLQEKGHAVSPMLKRIGWDAEDIGMDPGQILDFTTAEDLYEVIEKELPKVEYIMSLVPSKALGGDIQDIEDGSGAKGTKPGDKPGDNPGTQPGDKPGSHGSITMDEHGSFQSVEDGAVDDILRSVKESGSIEKEQRAGKNLTSTMLRELEFVEQYFDWPERIKQFMSSVIRLKSTWERPARLGEIMNPGLFKQGIMNHPTYKIAVYCDVSGSISQEDLNRFKSVLVCKPPEIELCVYTFDCDIHEWHDWLNSPAPGGGGTDFRRVVEHAESNVTYEDRPIRFDGHIVLTDGYDNDEPSPHSPRKWLWVSTGQLLTQQSGTWTLMPPTRDEQRKRYMARR